MNRSAIQTIGGSILALSIGALAAVWRSQPPVLPAAGATAEAAPIAGELALLPGRPLAPALAEALRAESGAKRWLILLAASEEAEARDLPGLIRAAGKDTAAVRMLGARWAELDAKHMFRSMYAEYLLPEDAPGALPARWALSEALFEHWTKSDPAAVIKALTEVPNFSRRDNLRMTVIGQFMKNDVEQGLIAMAEWGVRNYVPDMRKVAEWAEKDPQRASEVALKLGFTHAGREALKQIGKAWAQRDPAAGLRFAATLQPESAGALARELMSHWAQRDLSTAADFLASQPASPLRATMAGGLVEAWGRSDAAAALVWSEENLTGSARADAIGRLLKAAAERDIAGAAELAAGIGAGPVQSRACASVFEAWFNKGKEHRDAAFEWLGGLDDPATRGAALERVQWNWMWNDPAGAKDFISGRHGQLAPRQMIQQVARAQANKQPEAAMEWAQSLGGDRADAARDAVIESWVSTRPEAAGVYARKLPPGPARERAVRLISQDLAWQSVKQAADWYRALPPADQNLAREVFKGTGMSEDNRQELEKALAR